MNGTLHFEASEFLDAIDMLSEAFKNIPSETLDVVREAPIKYTMELHKKGSVRVIMDIPADAK